MSRAALARPEVSAFLGFYLGDGPAILPSTGYLALDAGEYRAALQAIAPAGPPSAPAQTEGAAPEDGGPPQ